MTEDVRRTRRFPRLRAEHAVMFRQVESGDESLARTGTVGLGGCMFLTDEALEPGTHLELLISVRSRVVRAGARVVYAAREGDDTWQVGVEFVEISPSDRAVIAGLFEE